MIGEMDQPSRAEMGRVEVIGDRLAHLCNRHGESCLCGLCLLRMRRYVELTVGAPVVTAELIMWERDPWAADEGMSFD